MLIFAGLFVVLLVVGLGGRFTGYLQEAVAGRFSAQALWILIGLRIPEFAQIVVPFSLFLAILVSWGRLHAEQEYTVLLTGGASPLRMLAWIATFTVPISLAVGVLSVYITPEARKVFVNLVLDQRIVSEFDAIVPGEFRSFSNGKRVTYAETVDRETKTIGNVFLGELDENTITTLWAKKGQYIQDEIGSRFLILESGSRYVGTPGSGDYRIVKFSRLVQRIEVEAVKPINTEAGLLPTGELNFKKSEHRVELYWRLSMPLIALVSAFCAFAMARVRPRAGRFGKILPGLVLFVAYYISVLSLRSVDLSGPLVQFVGFWSVHVLMFGIGVILLWRNQRPI